MTAPTLLIPAFRAFYDHCVPGGTVDPVLRGAVTAVAAPGRVDDLLAGIRAGIVETVERHAFRALIGAFHAFRRDIGLPATTDDDAALQRFGAHLEQPEHCTAILDDHPVLAARLRTVVAGSIAGCAELFTAFAADRALLRAAGLVPEADPRIAQVFLTGSDLHNGSRQVVGVRLACGGRLVYKPRTLVSDRCVADLFAAAEPYLKHSLQACVPASVTVGAHGWQRFVAARPMTARDEPGRYFYRFGALCAVLGAIGATDLHDENVLAHGEHPCVIDTETVVRADAGVEVDSLPHALLTHLKLSSVSTMLVPLANPTSPIDVLMAGVGVAGDQRSERTCPMIRNGGSDAVGVGWEHVTYRHGDNVPRLDGAQLPATRYYPDLLAGYFDGLRFVRGDEIAAVLDGYADMPVRTLLRSTMVYSRFLDAATHPDYLTRDVDADRLLGLLGQFPDNLSTGYAGWVAEAERAALSIGDVPLFTTRAGRTELATPAGGVPGAFRTAPLDFARRGIALNAARPDAYHQFLLEECFGEVADDPAGLSAESVFAPTLAPGARPGQWWPRIAATIAAIGVPFDGPDGPETGWLCGIGPDRGAPTVTPGNVVSFHDNGGLATFLQRAGRHDARLRAAGAAAHRGLTTLLAEYSEDLDAMPESVFTGAASLMLTRPETVGPLRLTELLDAVDARAAAGELEDGVANGPAGLLMAVLARVEAGEGDLCDEARLVRLCELALAATAAPRSAAWFDVAHGELGMRWACARAGRVLGDERLAREAADWLLARLPADDEIPVPGWCNGTAGLLLTAAEILTSAGRPDELTGARLAALVDGATRLPADRPVDLSVCHGSSGVVQSLLATARLLDDEALVHRAVEHQHRVITTARRRGFCTGAPGRTSLPGYMLGWAGVGDTDLLLDAAVRGGRTALLDLSVPVALTHAVRSPHLEGPS